MLGGLANFQLQVTVILAHPFQAAQELPHLVGAGKNAQIAETQHKP